MSPSRPGRSSAGAGRSNPKVVLAPADKLKREVQAALTDELAQDRHRSGFGNFDGFAYVGAEAYFHLAGGWSMRMDASSTSSWGRASASSFPYHRGRRRPFRYTPAGISRRARVIVARVRASRG